MISIKENEIISKIILPDKIQRYVKVPKEIILAKDLSEHRISTLLYLNYNQTWDEVVHYSPTYMIQWSGYKPSWNRSNKSNIYEKFKSCMDWCFLNGYLLDYDETKYVQSKYQTSLLNIEKIRPTDNFGLLYDFEIDFIKNYKSPYKNLNTSIILLILSYIRSFAWNRTNEVYDHSNTSKKEKPEIDFPMNGNRRHSWCKECHRENVKEKYIANRDFVNSLKDKCSICGYNKNKAALEWHHTDDNKEFTINERSNSKEETKNPEVLEQINKIRQENIQNKYKKKI